MRAQRSLSFCCLLTLSLTALFCWPGCRTTPITGRRQLLLVPEASEIRMGLTAFEDALAEESASGNQALQSMVQRVGQRLSEVANRPDYQWEFRLIESPEMNAFCLPGGKVAIYTGILPVCQTEAGLAVVMAHEIAHALARHGGERMSHEAAVTGVGKLVDYATLNRTDLTRERVAQAFGIASKYGFTLPYSRKHELEADHMGILLMARAGYDPREAHRFWERFGQLQSAGEEPIEFLSTHPADARRALALAELLPEAQAAYAQAAETWGLGETMPLPPIAETPPTVVRGQR